MSKIKNTGLDQYGAKAFKQQQFGTADIEGVKNRRLVEVESATPLSNTLLPSSNGRRRRRRRKIA